MKKIKFIYLYYLLVILSSIHDIYARINNGYNFFRISVVENSIEGIVFLSIGWLLFFASIIIIVLVLKKKLSKFLLKFPIYFVILFGIWFKVIPILIIVLSTTLSEGIKLLNSISRYNIILHAFTIGFAIYTAFKLNEMLRHNSF